MYTVWIECTGPALNDRHQLDGVDFNEFWQWYTDHITPVRGNDGTELVPRADISRAHDMLGAQLDDDPESVTAEAMAIAVLAGIRPISDLVTRVTVTRNHLSAYADDIVEATVTVREHDPVTDGELVAVMRRLAELNPSLKLNAALSGPR